MRVRLGIPGDISRDEMATAIDAALEASTAGSVPRIARGQVPTFETGLGRGIRWKPEPPGDEHFDSPGTVLRRGWGDCDDLAPWHAASLRATGEDPDAIARVIPSGPKRWHAIVERSDGTIEDPSKAAGMGSRVQGAGPPVWAPLFGDSRMALATHPYRNGWAGRVDLPDRALPLSWSALSYGSTPAASVVGAIRAVRRFGEYGDIDGMDEARLYALESVLQGYDIDQVVGELEDVGFLPFAAALAPSILPAAGALAKKIIPGGGGKKGGAPAGSAIERPGAIGPDVARAPGTVMQNPYGPIIVRF